MKPTFQIAAGSILGAEHRRIGKNNQDAFSWFQSEALTAAVVCDGCGSGQHSEIGAKLGVRLLTCEIAKIFAADPDLSDKTDVGDRLESVRQATLRTIKRTALSLGGSFAQVISDYFLFTALGAIITPAFVATFSIGDGLFIFNGEALPIGPFPGNEPPYMTYDLVESRLKDERPELLRFRVHHFEASETAHSLIIGSDGLSDLLAAADKEIPGRVEAAGPIEQFWSNDAYFANSDAIRRRLFLLNRESLKPDWVERRLIKAEGLLPDDTTLIVIRRKPDLTGF